MAESILIKFCTLTPWLDVVIYLKRHPNWFRGLGGVGVQIFAYPIDFYHWLLTLRIALLHIHVIRHVFYRPDILPISHATVSKHWRKHKRLTLPSTRTVRFFVSKVKDKNCSMCCSCDTYCVLHIPWVIITKSLMTSFLFKMSTEDVGVQPEQRIIIKFLVAEGIPSAEIHHRLAAVFKDDCLSRSRAFEWCSRFCNGWQHVTTPCWKTFKVQPSAGKIMLCGFWDSQRLLFLSILYLLGLLWMQLLFSD